MGIARTEHFDIARKIIANMTTESWQNIPHVCMVCELEADGLLEALRAANRRFGTAVGVNTLLLRAVAEALKEAPRMNAHMSFDRRLVRGRLDVYDNIDVSMPAILPDGRMMTLRVPDVGAQSLPQLQDTVEKLLRRAENTNMDEAMYAVSMADTLEGLRRGKLLQAVYRVLGARTGRHRLRLLTGQARRDYYSGPADGRLGVAELRQGTVTVSNLGAACPGWTGLCSILEIVPPQTAAIGLGAISLRPVARADGRVETARVLPLTVAFDHRAMDTGDVSPFIARLTELFAAPERSVELFMTQGGEFSRA